MGVRELMLRLYNIFERDHWGKIDPDDFALDGEFYEELKSVFEEAMEE